MRTLREPLEELLTRYAACSEPGSRVLELLSIVDLLFRVDGLRLCMSLLSDDEQQEDEISVALLDKDLGAGHWLSVVERLIKLPERRGSEYHRWFDAHRSAGHFQQLLDFRNAYAHCRGSREAAPLAASLGRIEQTLASCLADRPRASPFVSNGSEVLWSDGERTIAGAPLLLPGSVVGADDSVLCFSRRNDAELSYLLAVAGEQRVPAGKEQCQLLEQLVARKSGQTLEARAKKSKGEHGGAAALIRSFRQYAERSVKRYEARQQGPAFVARLEADTFFQGWLTRGARVLVVIGPEGAGVSCWLKNLVEQRVQAGNAVVFDSAGELPDKVFPDVLAGGLGFSGGMTAALHRAARESPDHMLLVVLDDVVIGGRNKGLFHEVSHWSSWQRDSEVRFVLALRSTEHGAAQKRWQRDTLDERLALLEFPRFSAHEVRLLAEALPCTGDAQRELETRRKLIAHLLDGDEDATRRPRFLVDVLSGASPTQVAELDVSPVALRARQFHSACRSDSRTLRGPLTSHLAKVLMDRRELRVPLYEPVLRESRLFFTEHGESTHIFEELVANGLVIEERDLGERVVGFASLEMFAFVAARCVDVATSGGVIMELVTLGQDFEPALDVAAHAVVRWAAQSGDRPSLRGEQASRDSMARLLRAVAGLDRHTFLELLRHLLEGSDLDWLLPALIAINDKGQSRTASLGLSLLAANPACSADLAEQARIANGHALWDLDQYAALELELQSVTARAPSAQLLRAMIATARGEFAAAKSLYEELAARPDLEADFALKIPMRSAPALIGLGQGELAERQLRDSLARISDARARAEIFGHIGETLVEQGRFSEAEQAYRDSMDLNRQLGSLVGQGVCHAVLGDLFCRQQRYDEASAALDLALDIARRVDNPWREAWTLLRMARVAEGTGNSRAAATFSRDGHAIFARLGCHAQ